MTVHKAPLVDRVAAAYARHFTWHTVLGLSERQPTRALGWPATAWLLDTLTARRAARVLECGSGWSTTALRMWAVEAPGRDVTTTDHLKNWLHRSRRELELEGLPTTRMYVHEGFATVWDGVPFDAMLVDVGNTQYRRDRLTDFVGWLRPGGLLVFDDWHVPEHAEGVAAWFREHGQREPVPVEATRDEFGRFVAVWERPTAMQEAA